MFIVHVETCIFLMGLFLIWTVRSVENKTENKGQKETGGKDFRPLFSEKTCSRVCVSV